ncbi:hypothetical protein GGR51DRAFT_531764 [Nemania sp. FL0031]|nr:hypothetical protein GGR51DRAFT_531764 [Nemania sp. FL0031]
MSIATAATRVAGWNVKFIIGPEKNPRVFAGIYQAIGSTLVTFRDVCNELRLCFEFPTDDTPREESRNNSENPWAGIAFALADRLNFSSEVRSLSFVQGKLLDQPVPSLAPTHPKQQNVIKYHVVSHKICDLPSNEPLDTHIRNGCARHLPSPIRRYDPRYLPPNTQPSDPMIAARVPPRQRLSASPKGSRSDSSLSSEEDNDDEDVEVNGILAPKNMGINNDTARKVAKSFQAACLTKATCCVVSRRGESWCPGLFISPGIQACHIVPQMHYHLYPSSENDSDVTAIEASSRRLKEAWDNTWSPENGILLRKDLHELFDARLFSIHPETFCIRVFVPCDMITEFNGKTALIHEDTDRKAVQHHYDMCCIENMAAARPNLSGITTRTLRSAELSLLPMPGLGVSRIGGSSKTQRPGPPSQSQPRDTPEQGALVEEADAGVALWEDEKGGKRRRLKKYQMTDSQASPQFLPYLDDNDMSERYITQGNSHEFLADVNWELLKFKKRQRAKEPV